RSRQPRRTNRPDQLPPPRADRPLRIPRPHPLADPRFLSHLSHLGADATGRLHGDGGSPRSGPPPRGPQPAGAIRRRRAVNARLLLQSRIESEWLGLADANLAKLSVHRVNQKVVSLRDYGTGDAEHGSRSRGVEPGVTDSLRRSRRRIARPVLRQLLLQ